MTCKTCRKTTWAGCGEHVDDVMRDVPPAERCPGHEKTDAGFLARLLGR
ncbi:hypothetical protein M3148_00860 [Georgenia satyanarayanai]|nr:hypothetical protein [Georgenia satyanarayanai]MCM3659550.1 hypothetical protein [Georgenia satyanarayanai]